MPFTMTDALSMSIVGMLIVFFVLIMLFVMIKVMRGLTESMSAPQAAAATVAPTAPAVPAANPNMVPAKGSVGEVKLYDVDDKTAAIIMAIVADKLEAPLNELRFHSIREKN